MATDSEIYEPPAASFERKTADALGAANRTGFEALPLLEIRLGTPTPLLDMEAAGLELKDTTRDMVADKEQLRVSLSDTRLGRSAEWGAVREAEEIVDS